LPGSADYMVIFGRKFRNAWILWTRSGWVIK
jgi:hypothetical protein